MKKEEFLGRGKYNPFIREKSEEVLRKVVREKQPQRVLEIGTFLGYSAALMLEEGAKKVTTIEKDETNCAYARQNLVKFGKSVEVVCADAGEFLENDNSSYDLIFLDGPKAQYHKYFPHLKRLLNAGGVLVCDDVLFYGLVQGDGFVKHKHRTIVERLRAFLDELQNDPDFQTTLYTFDDGLTVSVKKL